METSDHRASATTAKSNDPLTLSISGEDSDSWTLLGKQTDELRIGPSGVEIIKPDNEGEEESEENGMRKEDQPKQLHGSHRSIDSQLDESSDGISIISESDAVSCEKLTVTEDPNDDHVEGTIHFTQKINLNVPDYEPLTPPYTPDNELKTVTTALQVQRTQVEPIQEPQSLTAYCQSVPVHYSRWIIFGVVATAMAAIILGNTMRLQNRVDEINFEHEERISELELENNILKKEMSKLLHLYTRSQLDEQVQRAEFEWMEKLRQKGEALAESEEKVEASILDDVVESVAETSEQVVRKVPPQDAGVKRKVVWSGDEEEPMLIADKDYVLPAFCYNQDRAVQDDLFFEYSAKYCDVRKRKIEAKQRKSEQKRQLKQENYNKFIHPPSERPKSDATVDSEKPASPFNIDYKKAFDAIKAEGTIIVEAFSSILNLSPEPDEMFVSRDIGSVSDVADVVPSEHLTDEQKCHKPTNTLEDMTCLGDQKQDLGKRNDDGNRNKNYKHKEQKRHKSSENVRDEGKSRKNSRKQFDQDNDKYEKHAEQESRKGTWEQQTFDEMYKKHKKDDDKRENNIQEQQKQGQETDDLLHKKLGSADGHEDFGGDDGKKNFENRDKTKHIDSNRKQHGNRAHDSVERQKLHIHEESKRTGKSFDGERDYKHRKHHNNHHDQQGEWHEKRYKGREESRQNGEQKHNEWHEKRYKGREEYRQIGEQKQSEWHEKRYKGREEYRQKGGKHRDKRGSDPRHWQNQEGED